MEEVRQSQKENNVAGSTILENRIIDKLTQATDKKEKQDRAFHLKLATYNSKKLQKGFRALKRKEHSKEELEKDVEERIWKASNRKEQILEAKSKKLSKATQDKIQRGSEALRKQESSSRRLEDVINSKVISALNRKDERIMKKVEYISKKHLDQVKRRDNITRNQQKESKELECKLDTKMNAASQRREDQVAKFVQEISKKSLCKVERGQRRLSQLEKAKQKLDSTIRTKVISATERKQKLTYEQVKTVAQATNAKLESGEKALMQCERNARKLGTEINEKIQTVSERKEQKMAAKKEELISSNSFKKKQVTNKMNELDKDVRVLELNIEDKLSSASKRKELMKKKNMKELTTSNQNKERRSFLWKLKAQENIRKLEADLKEKMKQAEDRKILFHDIKQAKNLMSTNDISKTSDFSASPFAITPKKNEIDKKLEHASTRRKKILEQKSEQAAYFSNRKLVMEKRSKLNRSTSDLLGMAEPSFTACVSPRLSLHEKESNMNEVLMNAQKIDKKEEGKAENEEENEEGGHCIIL